MKKLVLATAIAALSVTAAQAAPTVYGKAYLTLDTATSKTDGKERVDGRTQLNSNASRIGLKGGEPLTANTDVVYKLEYRVEVDDNTRTFEARDAYLGLANKQYGTLLAGRQTAIDGNVEFANVTTGGIADGVLASFDAPRANNAFAYLSPSYKGLQVQAMYVMDENGSDTLGRDGVGAAVLYTPENQPFKFGVSHVRSEGAALPASGALADYLKAKDIEALGDSATAEQKAEIESDYTATFKHATRVSGSYDVTPALTVGALYQGTAFKDEGSKTENAFALSGSFKTQTPWTAYGQVDLVKNAYGFEDYNKQRYVAGGKYAFNKATTGHVYGALTQEKADTIKTNSVGFGAGLEYNF